MIHTAFTADVLPKHIVFLGDSITAGHTYPQLVEQVLQQASRRAPAVLDPGKNVVADDGFMAFAESY